MGAKSAGIDDGDWRAVGAERWSVGNSS